MIEEEKEDRDKESHNYFDIKEVLTYFFRKKDPSRPSNFNLKMMHGINKISILIFLVALIIIISRFIIRAL